MRALREPLTARSRKEPGNIDPRWNVTQRLTLNLGVRWDYDTNILNRDYATPEAIRAATAAFVPERYFTDGNDRDSPTDLIQPRIGLSFDLFDDDRTVLFGGVGRYFDRVLYNEILDESFRLQWANRTFYFSRDGQPRGGQPTIVWNDAYLSAAGLNGLSAHSCGSSAVARDGLRRTGRSRTQR